MGRPAIPLIDRLMAGVIKDAATGCWVWQKGTGAGGYGRISVRMNGWSRIDFTHRVSYELHVGPIPDGLVIDHLCRNILCCNPDHLEPVTSAENVRRGNAISNWFRGATHCIHGHEYTEENTYVTARGRYCRECRRRRNTESIARKKAAHDV